MKSHRALVVVGMVVLGLTLAGCNSSYGDASVPDAQTAKEKADAAEKAGTPSQFAVDYSEQDVNDAGVQADDHPNQARTFRASTHSSAVTRLDESTYPKTTSCMSCKSPTFLGAVNDKGADKVYAQPYGDARGSAGRGMTCWSCHADTPGTLRVTNKAFAEGLGTEAMKTDARSLACMQCHAESYTDPKTKETRFPYKYGFDPESVLKYYDEIEFADSLDPETGARLISVAHGQGESYVGGSHYLKGVDCPDCHLMKATTSDGEEYTDHTSVISMENEEVITQKCLGNCHSGKTVAELEAKVRLTEEKGEMRSKAARTKVDEFRAALVEAVKAGKLPEAKLEEARTLYRHADFYAGLMHDSPLDEGNGNMFHNNLQLLSNAEKATELAAEGLKLLGK